MCQAMPEFLLLCSYIVVLTGARYGLNNLFVVDMSVISSFVIQGFLAGRIRILLKGACEN